MVEQKHKLWLVIALAIVVLLVSSYQYWQKTSIQSAPAAQIAPPAGSEGVIIYISGAVNRPGVVKVAAASRVVEAVNAAGGLSPLADATKVNMAQALKDGMHIHLPAKDSAAASQPVAGSGLNGRVATVNINTASQRELEKLPGVGPAIAERIVRYREAGNTFFSVEELKKVPGIGESKYGKLKDQISI